MKKPKISFISLLVSLSPIIGHTSLYDRVIPPLHCTEKNTCTITSTDGGETIRVNHPRLLVEVPQLDKTVVSLIHKDRRAKFGICHLIDGYEYDKKIDRSYIGSSGKGDGLKVDRKGTIPTDVYKTGKYVSSVVCRRISLEEEPTPENNSEAPSTDVESESFSDDFSDLEQAETDTSE